MTPVLSEQAHAEVKRLTSQLSVLDAFTKGYL